MLHHQNRRVTGIQSGGRAAQLLLCGGKQIFPGRKLPNPPALSCHMAEDSEAMWMEVSFVSGFEWIGSAGSYWTDPAGLWRMHLESSTDLRVWRLGEFRDVSLLAHAEGWEYRARAAVPNYWQDVMVDLSAESNRWGKSIVGMTVMDEAVDLPGYPYAMPSDASRLQSDLRTAGYADASVVSSSAPLTARVVAYDAKFSRALGITQSGGVITDVRDNGATVALPNYPYVMPGDASLLQADLRAGDHVWAVVTLHADPWSITLPDLTAVGKERGFLITIDPGDPHPVWDFYEVFQGEAPNNSVTGTSGNVRDPLGHPLREADKQFARLGFSRLK